jgi:hypothetical protein
MKLFKIILPIVLLVCSIILFASCDKEDNPTVQETQLKKLEAKTWSVQSVQIDGVDHTSLFQGMTLTITKNSFTSTNGGSVWPSSGTWGFTDEQASAILRNDNTTITIESISESQLRLSLNWSETTFGPGRKKSISGSHVFDFN